MPWCLCSWQFVRMQKLAAPGEECSHVRSSVHWAGQNGREVLDWLLLAIVGGEIMLYESWSWDAGLPIGYFQESLQFHGQR